MSGPVRPAPRVRVRYLGPSSLPAPAPSPAPSPTSLPPSKPRAPKPGPKPIISAEPTKAEMKFLRKRWLPRPDGKRATRDMKRDRRPNNIIDAPTQAFRNYRPPDNAVVPFGKRWRCPKFNTFGDVRDWNDPCPDKEEDCAYAHPTNQLWWLWEAARHQTVTRVGPPLLLKVFDPADVIIVPPGEQWYNWDKHEQRLVPGETPTHVRRAYPKFKRIIPEAMPVAKPSSSAGVVEDDIALYGDSESESEGGTVGGTESASLFGDGDADMETEATSVQDFDEMAVDDYCPPAANIAAAESAVAERLGPDTPSSPAAAPAPAWVKTLSGIEFHRAGAWNEGEVVLVAHTDHIPLAPYIIDQQPTSICRDGLRGVHETAREPQLADPTAMHMGLQPLPYDGEHSWMNAAPRDVDFEDHPNRAGYERLTKAAHRSFKKVAALELGKFKNALKVWQVAFSMPASGSSLAHSTALSKPLKSLVRDEKPPTAAVSDALCLIHHARFIGVQFTDEKYLVWAGFMRAISELSAFGALVWHAVPAHMRGSLEPYDDERLRRGVVLLGEDNLPMYNLYKSWGVPVLFVVKSSDLAPGTVVHPASPGRCSRDVVLYYKDVQYCGVPDIARIPPLVVWHRSEPLFRCEVSQQLALKEKQWMANDFIDIQRLKDGVIRMGAPKTAQKKVTLVDAKAFRPILDASRRPRQAGMPHPTGPWVNSLSWAFSRGRVAVLRVSESPLGWQPPSNKFTHVDSEDELVEELVAFLTLRLELIERQRRAVRGERLPMLGAFDWHEMLRGFGFGKREERLRGQGPLDVTVFWRGSQVRLYGPERSARIVAREVSVTPSRLFCECPATRTKLRGDPMLIGGLVVTQSSFQRVDEFTHILLPVLEVTMPDSIVEDDLLHVRGKKKGQPNGQKHRHATLPVYETVRSAEAKLVWTATFGTVELGREMWPDWDRPSDALLSRCVRLDAMREIFRRVGTAALDEYADTVEGMGDQTFFTFEENLADVTFLRMDGDELEAWEAHLEKRFAMECLRAGLWPSERYPVPPPGSLSCAECRYRKATGGDSLDDDDCGPHDHDAAPHADGPAPPVGASAAHSGSPAPPVDQPEQPRADAPALIGEGGRSIVDPPAEHDLSAEELQAAARGVFDARVIEALGQTGAGADLLQALAKGDAAAEELRTYVQFNAQNLREKQWRIACGIPETQPKPQPLEPPKPKRMATGTRGRGSGRGGRAG